MEKTPDLETFVSLAFQTKHTQALPPLPVLSTGHWTWPQPAAPTPALLCERGHLVDLRHVGPVISLPWSSGFLVGRRNTTDTGWLFLSHSPAGQCFWLSASVFAQLQCKNSRHFQLRRNKAAMQRCDMEPVFGTRTRPHCAVPPSLLSAREGLCV